MSQNIEDFFPYVLPYARGAAEPVVVAALRDGAIDYCSRTHLWREWLQPMDLLGGTDILPLVAPADAEVLRLEEIWMNRVEIDPVTEDAIRFTRYLPGDVGPPRFYSSDAPGEVRMIPIPDQNYPQSIRARATLIPSRTATTLPDFLWKHYAREIADGALALLHAADEPYARPEALTLYSAKLESAIDRGTTQAAKSNMKSRRRSRAHFY